MNQKQQNLTKIREEVSNRYSFWFEDENGMQDGGLVYQMDVSSEKELRERVKEIYGTTDGLVVDKWTH